jgi:hypothetical protein
MRSQRQRLLPCCHQHRALECSAITVSVLLHRSRSTQEQTDKGLEAAQQVAAPEGDLHLAQRVGLLFDAALFEVEVVALWQILLQETMTR